VEVPLLFLPQMAKGTVLITGSAKRVGRELALYFVSKKYSVAIHFGNSASEAKALAHEINQSGSRAEIFQADLSKSSEVGSLIENVLQLFPDLNILINNASVFEGAILWIHPLVIINPNNNLKYQIFNPNHCHYKCLLRPHE